MLRTKVDFINEIFPNEHQHFDSINTQFRAITDLEILKPFEKENIINFCNKVSTLKN